jgi:class I fructose-bisphosphate aldolase
VKRRWHNIFRNDDRSFILAMDHAVIMAVQNVLSSPGEVLKKAISGGADTVLTSYGVAKHFHKELGNAGLILRVDGGTTVMHPGGFVFDQPTRTFSVEDAVRVGADGVMCMGFPGLEDEKENIRNFAHFARECERYGVVYGLEMVPGGFKKPEIQTLENIAFSCRMGVEYGADFIKSPYTGPKDSFKTQVVDKCYKPIVVLGGGSGKSDLELLTMVKEAIDAGCKGVAIGRNIWNHEDIEGICRAIAAIIHEDASVEAASQYISVEKTS